MTGTTFLTQTSGTDLRPTIGWLHRRAGFGLHPTELAAESGIGIDAAYSRLLTVPSDPPDPWAGLALDPQEGGRGEAIRAWIGHFLLSPYPYLERRTWKLHGWVVSGLDKAPPPLMVDQLRLFRTIGGGSYPELLRAVTTDRAMLSYLDGRTSTAIAPNENYGRELLELFALGVGEAADGSDQPYTEDDVVAAARALTGWVVRPVDDAARFVARRHDDTPQTLLGRSGVSDVDGVIDAVVAHPEHPRFVARRVAGEYIGDADDPRLDGVVDHLADVYTDAGMALDPTIDAALQLALEGTSTPIVLAPIPWLVACVRALAIPPQRLSGLANGVIRDMGQTPMFPPSVAGWPSGAEWFTSASLIARTNAADLLADAAAPSEPLVVAADDGDTDEMAVLLGLAEPFGPTTASAIRRAATPRARLTLALVSPEGLLS